MEVLVKRYIFLGCGWPGFLLQHAILQMDANIVKSLLAAKQGLIKDSFGATFAPAHRIVPQIQFVPACADHAAIRVANSSSGAVKVVLFQRGNLEPCADH